jgi:hypothetical protein
LTQELQGTSAQPPVQLTAVPGSRLEELHASYDIVKAQYEDAKARYDALTAALKNEMAATAPAGSTDITLTGAPGLPRLRLRWLRPYRFDSKRFKADNPYLYVQYEKRGGHYDLRAAD